MCLGSLASVKLPLDVPEESIYAEELKESWNAAAFLGSPARAGLCFHSSRLSAVGFAVPETAAVIVLHLFSFDPEAL